MSFGDSCPAPAIAEHTCLQQPSRCVWKLEFRGVPPTMSTPWILRRLYSLDPSSPDFLRQVYSLLRHDGEERYLPSLQEQELARLVDFLDRVRTLPSTFCPVAKRVRQGLSAVSANDDISRHCLHKLQAICGHHATLPSSYIISGEISRVRDDPIIPGAVVEAWEGTYRGERVSVKCLSVPLNDDQTIKRVRSWCVTTLLHLLNKNTCMYCSHSSEVSLRGKGQGTRALSLSSALQQTLCESFQNGCRTEL